MTVKNEISDASQEWGCPKPPQIADKHWEEWTQKSCVSPRITALTIESLDVKSNDDRKKIRTFLGWKQYPQKNPSGWIAYSGEFDGRRSENWGQFKPNEPLSFKGEGRKYLTPSVADGSREKQDCIILPTRSKQEWDEILADTSIEIDVTEGFKKIGALETQGSVALGFVGVNRWHEKGKPENFYPKLDALAKPSRKFNIYYDADWQSNPDVRHQLIKLGEQLLKRGCVLVIKSWEVSDSTKGIDDLIAKHPQNWREKISELSLEELKAIDAVLKQKEQGKIFEEYEAFKAKYGVKLHITKKEDGKINIPMADFFYADKQFGNGRIRFNEMLCDYELDGELIDWNIIRTNLEKEGIEFNSRSRCEEIVRQIGNASSYSPVRDYLNSLQPVDPKYLDGLACKYFGVPPSDELSKVFMRKWLIGAVTRVFDPGICMDYMLVLYGEQDAGKTEFFRRLASKPYFTDTFTDLTNKDELQKLREHWILELGEIDHLFNKREAEEFKRFLSTQTDSYRVAYGRGNKRYPRTCAFAGSSNQKELLKDETGNRRYLMITVPKVWEIPLDELEKDRDKIWGAAVAAYRAGESHFLSKEHKKMLKQRNLQHLEADIWEAAIREWLGYDNGYLREYATSDDILSRALGMETQHMNLSHQRRVGKIMRVLGWEKKNKKINGRVIKAFCKPATAENLTPTATQTKVAEPATSKTQPATLPATSETLTVSTTQTKVAGVAGNNEVWSTFSEDEKEKGFNFGSEKVLGNEPVFPATPATEVQIPCTASTSPVADKVAAADTLPATPATEVQIPCTAGVLAVAGNRLPDKEQEYDLQKKQHEAYLESERRSCLANSLLTNFHQNQKISSQAAACYFRNLDESDRELLFRNLDESDRELLFRNLSDSDREQLIICLKNP